jgi:hypothetical protein
MIAVGFYLPKSGSTGVWRPSALRLALLGVFRKLVRINCEVEAAVVEVERCDGK